MNFLPDVERMVRKVNSAKFGALENRLIERKK